nr:VQ-like protein [Tanacetum cinerariifolium]
MLSIKRTKNGTKKKDNNKLKVVHISSPMKVKTSASRFRALVQELTGRDSDISRYDVNYFEHVAPTTSAATKKTTKEVGSKPVECDHPELFTDFESFFDDVFKVDQLEGISPSYSSFESCLQ